MIKVKSHLRKGRVVKSHARKTVSGFDKDGKKLYHTDTQLNNMMKKDFAKIKKRAKYFDSQCAIKTKKYLASRQINKK